MPLRRSARCTRLTLLTAPRVLLLPGRYWSSCAAISSRSMLIAGLAVEPRSRGGEAAAPWAISVEVIAAPAITAAVRRVVLRMDISSPFREVGLYAAAAGAARILRVEPACR